MAAYRFTVNGVSLLNYLAEDGIKWTRRRGHGGYRGHQARVRDRPLHRSPGRKRHPDHVFQQHSHHLRDSQSGWHMYLERFILSTHRTLISSKPNNKKTPAACDSSGEDGKPNWNSVPFCMLFFTTLHL